MSTSTHVGARLQRAEARPVSKPGDRHEQEAERAAAEVARGRSVSGWSFSAVSATAAPVQRQDSGKPKSDDDKKKEALTKTGEALLETRPVKELKDKVLADPGVKKIKDAVTSPAGIAVTGAVAAGGVAALGAAHQPLPFQPPSIPLDKITPGLSAQIKYEGPVDRPTFVGLTITYKEQGPKGKDRKKDEIAADMARLRALDQMFKPADQRAREERAADLVAQLPHRLTELPPVTVPLVGTPTAAAPKADEQKKVEEQQPVQRAPATAAPAAPDVAHVDGALSGGGRPLDPGTRRTMESRFGRDFSDVRIHDDARAAAIAASIDAAAFTVGQDVAFGAGRYAPSTSTGRELLAHELAHTVQQQGGAALVQRQVAPPEVYPPKMLADELADLHKRLQQKSYPGREDDLRRLQRLAGVVRDRAVASTSGMSDAQLAAAIAAMRRKLRRREYAEREPDPESLPPLQEVSHSRADDRKRAAAARDRAAAVAEAQKEVAALDREYASTGEATAAPEPTPMALGPRRRGQGRWKGISTGIYPPGQLARWGEGQAYLDALDRASTTSEAGEPSEAFQPPKQEYMAEVPGFGLYTGPREGLAEARRRGQTALVLQKMERVKREGPVQAIGRLIGTVGASVTAGDPEAGGDLGAEIASGGPVSIVGALVGMSARALAGGDVVAGARSGARWGSIGDLGLAVLGVAELGEGAGLGAGGEPTLALPEGEPVASDPRAPAQVDPLGTTQVDPLGTTQVDPLGKTEVDPLGTTQVDPLGKTEVDPLGKTEVGTGGGKKTIVGPPPAPKAPASSMPEEAPGPRTQPSVPPAPRPAAPTGRGPTPVTEAEVSAAKAADPKSVHRSWHPFWHEQLWVLDGGRGPAPPAFRIPGGRIIVAPDYPL